MDVEDSVQVQKKNKEPSNVLNRTEINDFQNNLKALRYNSESLEKEAKSLPNVNEAGFDIVDELNRENYEEPNIQNLENENKEIKEEINENTSSDEDEGETKKREPGAVMKCLYKFFREGCHYRPVPTIFSTVLCLEITGGIFLLLGIIIMIFSVRTRLYVQRYDNVDTCQIGKTCKIKIKLEKDFKKPVMIYYQLNNFYQNHRRYIKSKSNSQLKGNLKKEGEIEDDCDPVILNKDIMEGLKSVSGKTLNPDDVAHPCGLIAKSFFNDTYTLYKENNTTPYEVITTDISWKPDRENFKNLPQDNWRDIQWLDVEDERFIVWMRPSAFPNFRKLWGKIEDTLTKGEYTLEITNNFPVESFRGKKSFVISTVNMLGGKNTFMYLCYMVLGAFTMICGVLFYFGYENFNKRFDKEKTEKLE